MSVQQAPLVLADISGYTDYLGGVELEHSQDVLADLLSVIAERLAPPLRLVKLEGDAVFCVGDADTTGADILTASESCYSRFASRRRTIANASSCTCDACRRIPDLDLKFLAHYGSFTDHNVAGRRELVGSDVVLAHRLLKNRVVEQTGIAAYALLTQSVVQSLAMTPDALGLLAHHESYLDVGEVDGWLLDVGERWRADQERNEVVVAADAADFVFSAEVARAPTDVWHAVTDPREQLRWRVEIDRYDMENPSGARGVGSTAHCVHGKQDHIQEIVDWRPIQHYTYTERNPAGDCLWTILLEPVDPAAVESTQLTWRIKLTGGLRQRAMMLVFKGALRKVLAQNFESLVEYLNQPSPTN
jgi:uncharacterized protein YndB with AHSA1/START domain